MDEILTNVTGVEIAIIGGSGLYHLEKFQILGEYRPLTPWGLPSDALIIARLNNTKICFLARHGRGHHLNPTQVPYRANIAALKHIGVKIIIAFSAVGSLREEIQPLHFVIPDQLIDRTTMRKSTFFEDGISAHISFADPFCLELTQIIGSCLEKLNLVYHKNKTLVVMEGPAFSTRAESKMYRAFGADIINMSGLPESKLAAEAEICYAMVCMTTDYDSWRVNEETVSLNSVLANLSANSENALKLLTSLIPVLEEKGVGSLNCVIEIEGTAKNSIITAVHKRIPETVGKLSYILDL